MHFLLFTAVLKIDDTTPFNIEVLYEFKET